MVEKPFIVEALKQDSQIARVLDMAERCDTAIFSVGNLERPSILFEMGMITHEEYQDMIHRGVIGDCCSHFLNRDGNIFDQEMDAGLSAPLSPPSKKFQTSCWSFPAKRKKKSFTPP